MFRSLTYYVNVETESRVLQPLGVLQRAVVLKAEEVLLAQNDYPHLDAAERRDFNVHHRLTQVVATLWVELTAHCRILSFVLVELSDVLVSAKQRTRTYANILVSGTSQLIPRFEAASVLLTCSIPKPSQS